MAARTKVFVDIVTRSDGKEPGAGLKKFAIGAGVAALAVAGLIKIGKELVTVFAVQEQAEAKLIQTIKSTGKAAGLTADVLFDMASGLQEVTKFGDEAIIGAETLLLTFKDIGGDIFPRALESILDVSEAMGTGLKESTIQLGKALNDPIGGIAALTRVGIQFTDEQKNMIKSLVETGDKAAAQTIILEELESQFGGVARAAADTATGSFTQLGYTLGDLQEQMGQNIAEGLQPMAEATDNIVKSLINWIQKNRDVNDFLEDMAAGADVSTRSMDELQTVVDSGAEAAERMAKGFGDAFTQSLIDAGIEAQGLLDNLAMLEAMERRYATAIKEKNVSDAIAAKFAIDSKEAEKTSIIRLEEIRIAGLTTRERELELIREEINELWKFRDVPEVMELINELAEERADLLKEEIELTQDLFGGRTEVADEWLEKQRMIDDAFIASAEAQTEADQIESDKRIAIAEIEQAAKLSIISSSVSIATDLTGALLAANIIGAKRAFAVTKALATGETIINTAAAIAEASPNPFAIGAAIFLGAAQLAKIHTQTMPSLATGGQFITDGPTLIGDNASGQERITVEPLGGGNNNGGRQIVYFQFAPGVSLKGYMQELINTRQLHSSTGGII